jgi:hypothetical protein
MALKVSCVRPSTAGLVPPSRYQRTTLQNNSKYMHLTFEYRATSGPFALTGPSHGLPRAPTSAPAQKDGLCQKMQVLDGKDGHTKVLAADILAQAWMRWLLAPGCRSGRLRNGNGRPLSAPFHPVLGSEKVS